MVVPDFEGILFGIGSILLDIYADVDKAFLDKWRLKENEAQICDESRLPIFDEMVKNYKVTFIPGGASPNAVRVCQAMLNKPGACSYFGIVGNDNYGDILIEELVKEGINIKYETNNTVQSGTCAVLISGVNRSLCSYTAAGRLLNVGHIQRPDVWQLVEKAKYLYVPGYTVVASVETSTKLAEHSDSAGKVFVSNISATYIPQKYRDSFMALLPYVDVLFGNSDEALALSEAANLGTKDLGQIALKISEMKKISSRPRLVVITQGCDQTIVVRNGEIRLFPVKEIKAEKIVDTSGAGDSFVGGFLSQYMQNGSLDECIRAANYSAWSIIQRRGCSMPKEGIYKLYTENK